MGGCHAHSGVPDGPAFLAGEPRLWWSPRFALGLALVLALQKGTKYTAAVPWLTLET